MALTRSFVLSIGGTIAGVLLEVLLFLPGSPTGAYLEATLGVSSATIITLLIAAIGIVLLVPSIIVIAMTVIRWRRTFHAELVGKDRFLLGESVRFKAWFKGELKNGLFTCKVQLPDGNQEWWPAYDTFRRSENGDFGVLSGRKVHEAEWSVLIAKGYPIGQYTVKIGVWDRVDLGSNNTPVKEKQASFWVLPPGYQGSPGITAVVSSGDAGFVIEQRTEAGQDAHPDLLTHVHAVAGLLKGPLVARTSDLGTWANPIQPASLDQRFSDVYAFFFYPKSVSWEKGERDPRKLMPRLKAIVNYSNKKAFWMLEYALALFKEGKIQSVTAELDPYTEEEMEKYLKNHGIDLVDKPASEVDLQQGTHVK
ncbi:MAG: hypothetical protein ABSC50_13495 [Candidatus Bathyarchaeia archaeon]|jgi:hypothetical protein